MFPRIPLAFGTALTAGALLLSACGDGGPDATGERLSVVAAFYPLQYAAEQVGGDQVEVTNLTELGAEPHHLELTPKDMATIAEADLVVYLKGFQPAVDEAVEQAGENDAVLDAGAHADLLPLVAPPPGSGGTAAHDEHNNETGHDDGHDGTRAGMDPHFWLDPLRYASVGEAIARRLGALDPEHAERYGDAAARLNGQLNRLDADFTAALASCDHKDLVTSHSAFGYLADRYGLTEIPIAGLSPDSEPSPGRQAEVASIVRERGISTIYYDTLEGPAVAQALATEAGAAVAALDPLEGLTDESADADYLGVMRTNLATLRKGQPCS